MMLKKIFWFWWRKKNQSDTEFLSYNLMLNSGNLFSVLRDKNIYIYSSSRGVRKQNSERNKKTYPPPPPLQAKWSVPNFLHYLFVSC